MIIWDAQNKEKEKNSNSIQSMYLSTTYDIPNPSMAYPIQRVWVLTPKVS